MRDLEDDRQARALARGRPHDRGPVRVAFAAAHTVPSLRLATAVIGRLAELPAGSAVLLRKPRLPETPTGVGELLISRMAEAMGHSVEWYTPEGSGRAQVYLRDFRLVRAADRVEAFFDDDGMPGGTGHVVDAALASERPCYAWLVGQRGDLLRIGEWEPDEV